MDINVLKNFVLVLRTRATGERRLHALFLKFASCIVHFLNAEEIPVFRSYAAYRRSLKSSYILRKIIFAL